MSTEVHVLRQAIRIVFRIIDDYYLISKKKINQNILAGRGDLGANDCLKID